MWSTLSIQTAHRLANNTFICMPWNKCLYRPVLCAASRVCIVRHPGLVSLQKVKGMKKQSGEGGKKLSKDGRNWEATSPKEDTSSTKNKRIRIKRHFHSRVPSWRLRPIAKTPKSYMAVVGGGTCACSADHRKRIRLTDSRLRFWYFASAPGSKSGAEENNSWRRGKEKSSVQSRVTSINNAACPPVSITRHGLTYSWGRALLRLTFMLVSLSKGSEKTTNASSTTC